MGIDRRIFIKRSLYAVLAILGLGFIFTGWKSLSPPVSKEKELRFFPLIPEEDAPRSGVKKAELSYSAGGRDLKTRIYIVSSGDEIAAFSAVCSHLGCLVNYNKDKREFACPCHGGRYDLIGNNVAGPPPAPLSRFPVMIRDGIVYVGVKT